MPEETVWVEISRHPANSANCTVPIGYRYDKDTLVPS